MKLVAQILCACLAVVRVCAVWPRPASVEVSTTCTRVDAKNFDVHVLSGGTALLQQAVERYREITFSTAVHRLFTAHDQAAYRELHAAAELLRGLDIVVKDPSARLTSTTSEAYRMTVQAPRATLTADTTFGAMRGLETFSQLLTAVKLDLIAPGLDAADAGVLYLMNHTSIEDEPRFAHRGLLVDTSRHWLPVRLMLTMLDAMAWNKLNVLHWHLTDDSSFPFRPPSFPNMNLGAFHPRMVYSESDISTIVEYAHNRGIRVYVEMDTPGHAASMAKGLPQLLTECFDSNGRPDGTLGPVDPTREDAYRDLAAVYGDLAAHFPDELLHIGGDEVDVKCWKSNPKVRAWVDSKGWDGAFGRLQGHFTAKLSHALAPLNKTLMVWQEAFDNDADSLPDDTVVQVWKASAAARALQEWYASQEDDEEDNYNDEMDDLLGNRGAGDHDSLIRDKLPADGASATVVNAALYGTLDNSGAVGADDGDGPLQGRYLQALNFGRLQVDAEQSSSQQIEWPTVKRRRMAAEFEKLTGWEDPDFEEPGAVGDYEDGSANVDRLAQEDAGNEDNDNDDDDDYSGNGNEDDDDADDAGGYLLELEMVVKRGHRAVLSAPWYLDRYRGGPTDSNLGWQKMFKVNPHGFKASAAAKALVIGGEACLWGEYIDASNLMQRAWPRAAAVAERLWSPAPPIPPRAETASTDQVDLRRRRLLSADLAAGGPAAAKPGAVASSAVDRAGVRPAAAAVNLAARGTGGLRAGVAASTALAAPRPQRATPLAKSLEPIPGRASATKRPHRKVRAGDSDSDSDAVAVQRLAGSDRSRSAASPSSSDAFRKGQVEDSAADGADIDRWGAGESASDAEPLDDDSEEANGRAAPDLWADVIAEATVRLREHRCRMMARGVLPEPVGFDSAVPNEGCHPDAMAAAGAF